MMQEDPLYWLLVLKAIYLHKISAFHDESFTELYLKHHLLEFLRMVENVHFAKILRPDQCREC